MTNKLKMFVCGPTVYDYIHIGNARTFVIFDAYAKWLRHTGVDLEYIMNITDIEDRIIIRAKERNKDIFLYSQEFENIFYADAKALGITSPEYKKATDHIPEVISQVERLIQKKHAYWIEGDGWYFDLSTFPDYGKLSGRTNIQDDDAVSRIDENPNKKNRGDFCLWKVSKPDEPSWDSPWGKGRPGWHIEDTAITEKYFGPQYDIHGGGADLKFPHHEAEVAQMESLSGLKPFVKKWMHAGFLVNKSKKMSKSLGNFMTAHEALQLYSPEALRFYFLSAHYRSPLDYTQDNIKQAEAAVMRIREFLSKLNKFEDEMDRVSNATVGMMVAKAEKEYTSALNDDFNTPKAFGVLFELIKTFNAMIGGRTLDQASAKALLDFFTQVHAVLGIVPSRELDIPPMIAMQIEQRERARRDKDFALADKLRKQIEDAGYKIDDTTYGPLVKKI